jgi:hypothetical protein
MVAEVSVLPALLVAVTWQVTWWPASPATGTYVVVVAPGIVVASRSQV